jgi:DMSO/TMAO reductase YedYZ molybdopterin-dependent catalytic subunit
MVKMEQARALQRFPLTPAQLVDRRTRVEDAIVLCHLGVAQLTRDEWSLVVHGLVERSITLHFDDLVRYPKLELASVHQCCGSPFAPFEPTRRVTNVTWGGARLADLLANCRPAPSARYLWSYGSDSGEFSGGRIDAFCKDLPLEQVSKHLLVAYEMNGEPLRPEHVFPARLVVPGFYGTNSCQMGRAPHARG